MKPLGTLLLRQSDIADLLSFSDCVSVVEEAFRLHGESRSLKPELMHVSSGDGEFHVKAGGLQLEQRYFALKANGGFFQNAARFGMPNIQGVILLSDGEHGYPLALMESREITMKRTGAATAVAAKYLAQPGSDTVTICGTGTQARIQLLALASTLALRRTFIYSRSHDKAVAFAAEMSAELGTTIEAATSLASALEASQICVTCTPSKHFFVHSADVPPGLFIAAVGTDSPGKQEIDPALLWNNTVVADILDQAVHVGDLQYAIAEGMSPAKVHAELADIVTGKKPGRTSKDEIIIFDSTGTALQDVAAAVSVYKKAIAQGRGTLFNFFA